MISIFNGRERTLGGETSKVYAQVGVGFRDHLHNFKGAKLGVFLAISLHANKGGWAWPSVSLLSKETGYNAGTINKALKELCALTIKGERVLLKWQPKQKDSGQFHSNHYLLFPSASEVAEYRTKGMRNTVNNLPSVENTETGFSPDKVEPSLEVEPTKHVATATPAQNDTDPHHCENGCSNCGAPSQVLVDGLCSRCREDVLPGANATATPAPDDATDETPLTHYERRCQGCGIHGTREEIDDGGLCYECSKTTCYTCMKLFTTTTEMPDVHNTCTCEQEATLTEHFGERPKRPERKPPKHWTEHAAQAWAKWGMASSEFRNQLQRFGDSGYIVQELGYKLEIVTGLHPLWGDRKKVRGWSSGLWELYEESGHSIETAVEAARSMRQSKLTISKPRSIVNTARALAAEKVAPPVATSGMGAGITYS